MLGRSLLAWHTHSQGKATARAGGGGTSTLRMMRKKRKATSTFTSLVTSHSDSRPSASGFLRRHMETGWGRPGGQRGADGRHVVQRQRRRDSERATEVPGTRPVANANRKSSIVTGGQSLSRPRLQPQGGHGNTFQGTARRSAAGLPNPRPTRENTEVPDAQLRSQQSWERWGPDPSPIL